jgi:pentatricopeptide repeat protein
VACSFWLIDALVRSGHAREARKLWRELTSRVSEQRVDDGLEQADDLSTGR